VPRDQFIGHGKCWNNVAAGSATSDKNAKFLQAFAFRVEMQGEAVEADQIEGYLSA
jgi:hypothetical protein